MFESLIDIITDFPILSLLLIISIAWIYVFFSSTGIISSKWNLDYFNFSGPFKYYYRILTILAFFMSALSILLIAYFIRIDIKSRDKIISTNENNETGLSISKGVDFMYLNDKRINSLYSQILPELRLKSRSVETKSGASAKVNTGNDLISLESEGELSRQNTSQYESSPETSAFQCLKVINFFASKGMISYESVNINSDDITQLREFKNIAKTYDIEIDEDRLRDIENENLKNELARQDSIVDNLQGPIILKGEFLIINDNSKVELLFDYAKISPAQRITFNTLPIIQNSPNIKSESLKSNSLNQRTIKANIFCKIMTKVSEGNQTKFIIEPYAIW